MTPDQDGVEVVMCAHHPDEPRYAPYQRGIATIDRFFRHVFEAPGECWQWRGFLTEGYGRFRLDPQTFRKPHRLAYEWFVAEIPDGLVLDHLCRNRACVNPWHLEPVTPAVNAARGFVAESHHLRGYLNNHCNRGHEFSSDNTWVSRGGVRKCRTCGRENKRAWRQGRKGETP